MRLYLNHGWLDPCSFIERHQRFEDDVGQTNSVALTLIDETFHRSPCLKQGDAIIVNDLSVLIAGIVVVSRLECEGGVDQVEIDEADPESLAASIKGWFNPFWPVIGIPELRCNEYVFTSHHPGCQLCSQSLTYFSFIPIPFGAIKVSKPNFQRFSGSGFRFSRVGNQSSKA